MMQLEWRDRISLTAGLVAVVGVLTLSIGLLSAEPGPAMGGLVATVGAVVILLLQRRSTGPRRR